MPDSWRRAVLLRFWLGCLVYALAIAAGAVLHLDPWPQAGHQRGLTQERA